MRNVPHIIRHVAVCSENLALDEEVELFHAILEKEASYPPPVAPTQWQEGDFLAVPDPHAFLSPSPLTHLTLCSP